MKHRAKRLKKVAFVLFAMSESIASKSKEREGLEDICVDESSTSVLVLRPQAWVLFLMVSTLGPPLTFCSRCI